MTKAQAPTVGFVTTCRGRLHHLQQTIPRIVAEQPDEIIVVDHDCPQGTGDWLEKNYPASPSPASGTARPSTSPAPGTWGSG